jgi:5-methylthioadenosine/S-adenosylhomocysteine deaminase
VSIPHRADAALGIIRDLSVAYKWTPSCEDAARARALPAQSCRGEAIAMGTDNMAEDMVESMRTGLFMERVRLEDARRPQPEDVLEWATRNGARALGLGADVGALEVGRKADP